MNLLSLNKVGRDKSGCKIWDQRQFLILTLSGNQRTNHAEHKSQSQSRRTSCYSKKKTAGGGDFYISTANGSIRKNHIYKNLRQEAEQRTAKHTGQISCRGTDQCTNGNHDGATVRCMVCVNIGIRRPKQYAGIDESFDNLL